GHRHQTLARTQAEEHVEAVVGSLAGVGRGDIGPGQVGADGRRRAEAVVDVDADRPSDRGRVQRPAGAADAAGDDGAPVDVAGRVDLETGPVVVAGGVVGARRGGARAVEAPRLGAGDDPAHDGPEAADVLVALAVAEPGAAGLAVVAVAVGAPAGRAGAP